jgi:hypothetical protein
MAALVPTSLPTHCLTPTNRRHDGCYYYHRSLNALFLYSVYVGALLITNCFILSSSTCRCCCYRLCQELFRRTLLSTPMALSPRSALFLTVLLVVCLLDHFHCIAFAQDFKVTSPKYFDVLSDDSRWNITWTVHSTELVTIVLVRGADTAHPVQAHTLAGLSSPACLSITVFPFFTPIPSIILPLDPPKRLTTTIFLKYPSTTRADGCGGLKRIMTLICGTNTPLAAIMPSNSAPAKTWRGPTSSPS